MNHFKAGNTKIDKSCLISCLPTTVCFGKGKQCKGCYAKGPEVRFPTVLASRERKLAQTKAGGFVYDAIEEIRASKKTTVRVHESGDFYSQAYIDAYVAIATMLPNVQFYTYTKKMKKFDFSVLANLDNFNLIDSITPIGLNFGPAEYCETLVADYGYTLCPCGVDADAKCMRDCTACATVKKVCFLKH